MTYTEYAGPRPDWSAPNNSNEITNKEEKFKKEKQAEVRQIVARLESALISGRELNVQTVRTDFIKFKVYARDVETFGVSFSSELISALDDFGRCVDDQYKNIQSAFRAKLQGELLDKARVIVEMLRQEVEREVGDTPIRRIQGSSSTIA